MKKEKPLVDKKILLRKFSGKGGWTYAEVPEILPNKNNPFGWVKVKGKIDHYELKQYKLMPLGNGKLFLPVKKEIRKKIGKASGDWVHVILDLDDSLLEIPKEILDCFEQEPRQVLLNFHEFSEGERKSYLDWIYQAKTEETKANRILIMMDRVQKNLKYFDKE